MIEFYSETDFELSNEKAVNHWITAIIEKENCSLGDITYVFCDDEYLYEMNVEYLNHDTYTDIISFDYRVGNQINGEIYISVDRVKENATEYGVSFENELLRVIIHGILHFLGHKDKSDNEAQKMRLLEEEALKLFEKQNLR